VDSSLYFLSLGFGVLGFLEDSLNMLGPGFYPKKTKELGFVRNPRVEKAYACWRRRERRCFGWSQEGLLVSMLACGGSLVELGF
jgi:hypothetical protein